jgi:predicted transcriptional regulator
MLTLEGLRQEIGGELLTPGMDLGAECAKVFASDLMSDVLSFMERGSVLMTGLVNPYVIRTSRLLEVAGIVVVQGKRPGKNVIREALEHRIPIIMTECTMFETCARVSRLVPGKPR